MNEMPNLPEARCACWDPKDYEDIGCICGASERVLRAVERGDIKLDAEQREWCLDKLGKVEGYNRSDHVNDFDRTLAHAVLCSWVDYARDKGLL